MRIFLSTICLLLWLPLASLAQNWAWVQMIHGEGEQAVTQLCMLPQGDVAVAGVFQRDAEAQLSSRGGRAQTLRDALPKYPSATLFLARYKPNGALRWAIHASADAEGISPTDLQADSEGNIVVCGHFKGRAVFYSVNGNKREIAGYALHQNPNYFVAKYSGNGNLLWLSIGRTPAGAFAQQLLIDAQNNVYVRAYTYDATSITLDDFALLQHPVSGTSQRLGFFITKYSPKGKAEWVTYGGGTHLLDMRLNSETGGVSLLHISYQHVYIFTSEGKTTQLHHPNYGQYVLRQWLDFDAQGNYVAARAAFAGTEAIFIRTQCDAAGNTYALLEHARKPIGEPAFFFKSGEKQHTARSPQAFVAKFSPSEQLLWVARLGDTQTSHPLDIALDKQGNVLVSGWYERRMWARSANGSDSAMLNAPWQATFMASLNAETGALAWASNIGSMMERYAGLTNWDLPIAIDASNRVFFGGLANMGTKVGGMEISLTDVAAPEAKNYPQFNWRQFADGFFGCIGDKLPPDPDEPKPDTTHKPPVVAARPVRKVRQSAPAPTADTSSSDYAVAAVDSLIAEVARPFSDIFLYPNPVERGERTVTVVFQVASEISLTWEIFDLTGARLAHKRETYPVGEVQLSLPFDSYAAGVYVLTFTAGKHRETKRVVVL